MNQPHSQDDEFPMRLNKFLAHQGVATRRDADVLIAAGRVHVNGKKATLGLKVNPDDKVKVTRKNTGKSKVADKERYYFAYNKPRGVITHSPQDDEVSITDQLPAPLRRLGLFPLGRLDKDSYGLILLTNDGRMTERLLSPEAGHEKEYAVKTKLPLRDSFKTHMEKGVDIEGYVTKPAKIRLMGEKSFSITITEGKKHQIRRMVVAMHNEVVELKRTRIMNIKLGTLAKGQARAIEGEERTTLLSSLGIA